MTLAALESGTHVLCDKPMAMDSDQSKKMLEKAKSLNRVHMMDHELRFNPTRQKIKDLLDEGFVGKVQHVNITNITPSWGDPCFSSERRLVVFRRQRAVGAWGAKRFASNRPAALVVWRRCFSDGTSQNDGT